MRKDADTLAFLLELNQQCAARETAGHPITPPGLPLPPGERLPFAGEDPEPDEVERMLIRVPRADGRSLARALADARAVRSARRASGPVRVQVDPVRIG